MVDCSKIGNLNVIDLITADSEAIAADKWHKFMVEVKEAKRWADVEDSDGDLTTNAATEQAAAVATAPTTDQAALAKAKYKSVHALDASAPFQQCADVVHTDSIRASQAAEQAMQAFCCAFANAMLPGSPGAGGGTTK